MSGLMTSSLTAHRLGDEGFEQSVVTGFGAHGDLNT